MRREVGASMAEERHKSEETGKRMRTKSKRTSTKPPKVNHTDKFYLTNCDLITCRLRKRIAYSTQAPSNLS